MTTLQALPATSLLPTVGESLHVPVLGGEQVPYANLDYAATAPALAVVAENVTRALPAYASVHRGAGLPSRTSTALYERARAVIAEHCGARPDDVAVIVRNTTDALNLLARSVPGDAEVLSCDLEHHANLLPWRGRPHRCVPVAGTFEATLRRLAIELAARPVALVAITGASNVTGEVLPVERVVALAHRHGARVVVDAAQLAPHGAVDLATWDADYVVLSGHKLYAPYGAGVLVGRRDWLDAAEPYLAGGGAVTEVTADRADYAPAPHRHEGGTPNLLGAIALATACRALAEVGIDAVTAHEHALRERLLDGLARLDAVRVHRTFGDLDSAIGLVTFSVDGFAPGHVSAYLSAEHGIGVRDGRFCAHQLVARLGAPGGAIRASFGAGTTGEHVERLIAALEQLLAGGAAAEYTQVGGEWVPVADDRAALDAASLLG